MYTLIRLFEVVEKGYNFENIEKSEYLKYINKYYPKYTNFKKQIKGFDLEKFMEVFNFNNLLY
jgi:hypothetical protein